jgi:hypothetical protein
MLFGFLFLLVACAAADGQQITSQSHQLALEVHFYPNEPPAYQMISTSSNRGGAWYARFGKQSNWAPPEGAKPVSAVDIRSELAEEGVRVWVSVFLGKLHEEQRKVTSYILHEGDKVTVQELSQFGVEPFKIAAVRISPLVAGAPKLISKAPSIEIVSVRQGTSTLPAYTVVVRNVSNKMVKALRVQVLQSGRLRNTFMPQSKEGKPLISPGEALEFSTRVAINATPTAGGYAPVVLPDQVIQISAAVFEDGSFEGDGQLAVEFTAFQKGRKLQLERIVGLFQKSLTSDGPPPSVLDSLRADVSSLSFEANSDSVGELITSYPKTPQARLKTLIEIGMKGLRDEVLKDIVQFELQSRRRLDANTLRDWLGSSRDRYQAWFGRL